MRTFAALVCAAFASVALGAEPAAGVTSPPARRPLEGYGKPEGLIPYTVIGPKLSIITVPAPGFGLEAKFLNRFGASVDYNLIPDVKFSGDGTSVKAGYTDLSLAARWFPFDGRFFLGAAYGNREFHAKGTDNAGLEARVKVRSTYLAPEIGWRFVSSIGFFYGIDLGYQLILSKKTTYSYPGAVETDTAKDVKEAGDEIGKIGLPIISLMQLGWYF